MRDGTAVRRPMRARGTCATVRATGRHALGRCEPRAAELRPAVDDGRRQKTSTRVYARPSRFRWCSRVISDPMGCRRPNTARACGFSASSVGQTSTVNRLCAVRARLDDAGGRELASRLRCCVGRLTGKSGACFSDDPYKNDLTTGALGMRNRGSLFRSTGASMAPGVIQQG